MTKHFTAAAIMRLVEVRKVRTEDQRGSTEARRALPEKEVTVVRLVNALDLTTPDRATSMFLVACVPGHCRAPP